jgi:WD40 repeat protein
MILIILSLLFAFAGQNGQAPSPQQAVWATPTYGTSRLAISPDGKTLAANSFDLNKQRADRFQLRDTATGQVRVTQWLPERYVSGMIFTPDGLTLLTAHEYSRAFVNPQGRKSLEMQGDVRQWDVTTGQLRRILFHQPNAAVFHFALSPDGKTLAVRETWYVEGQLETQSHLVLWDMPQSQVRIVLPNAPRGLFTFTPESKHLIVASSGALHVLDAVTGKELYQLGKPPQGQFFSSVPYITPDGKTLLVRTLSHELVLWDLPTRTQVGTLSVLQGHDILGCALSPDGRTVAVGHHEDTNSPDLDQWRKLVPEIVLFDLATRQPRLRLSGHRGYLPSLVFSPDGKLLYSAGGCDETIRVWQVR